MNIPRKNDLQIDCDVYDIGQKLLPELEHDDALIIPANIDFEDFIPGHEHQIENSQASARMPEALIVANQNLLNNQMKLLGQLESLEEREEQINNAYQQLAAILDFLPDATGVIDREGKVTVWNRAMEELTGVKAEDILGKANHAYSLPFYGRRQDALIDLVMMPLEQRQKYPNVKDQNNILTMEKYFPLIKSGSFLECKAACLFDKKGNKMGAIESIRDVSRQKQIENAARTSEARYRNVLENIEEGYYEVDLEGNYTFCNPYLMNYLGMDPERVPGLNFRELMDKENANKVEKAFNRVFKTRQTIREFGWYVQIKEGGIIYVETTVSPILENDRVIGFRGLIRDLSERREAIDKLEYMSMHDSLTGLYNRFYFEEEMRRLESGRLNPVALILFDVDGLKLVNDTLGHDKGDQVLLQSARIISQCFRNEDVVARVGGDEFAVILPKTTASLVEDALKRITEKIKTYNQRHPELPLSLSAGYAIRDHCRTTMYDIYKQADDKMYRQKLHSRQSNRSVIVQTLMKAMSARDYITEGHGDRLQYLISQMAEMINLSEDKIKDLCLFAQFHDIGKVGVPDSILFKPGPLSTAEYKEMQRHSEIGQRIALSAPDLTLIADWILKHHEWWNGQGYPLGLVGIDIPLECRLLAIADAYDAMTHDRPYRQALSETEAMEEIQKMSGIQFDPALAKKFIQLKK